MRKYKKLYFNTKLCVKYPFLYPRNRFSGMHYNNQKLAKIIWDIKRMNHDTILMHFYRKGDDKIDKHDDEIELSFYQGISLLLKNNKKVCMYFSTEKYFNVLGENDRPITYVKENLEKYTYNKNIVGIQFYVTNTVGGFKNYNFNIIIDDEDVDHKYPNMHIIGLDTTSLKDNFKLKMCNYLNNILQIFHCLPTSTELDAMPDGWRKAFGLQMCEEIKQSLLKHGGLKALFNYRITQIKEKFATLRWYDANTNGEIQDIISKYEDISYHTCINCGKEAKYISKGWISPYCEECVGESKERYTLISEENNYL